MTSLGEQHRDLRSISPSRTEVSAANTEILVISSCTGKKVRQPGDPQFVSAGLGLVDERERLQSYNVTFTGRPIKEIRERATALGIPGAFADELKAPRSLTILALGHDYLRACAVHSIGTVNGPVLALVAQAAVRTLPARFIPMLLDVHDTRHFGAGFVALVVAKLLEALVHEPTLVSDPGRLVERVRHGQR